jgi:hypothetical protein
MEDHVQLAAPLVHQQGRLLQRYPAKASPTVMTS